MAKRFVANKTFKYDGKIYRLGDPISPAGSRFDRYVFDPANRFVLEKDGYACPHCGRAFDKPQGLAAHSRYCESREDK